jgi:DNA helicase-2/ATP-dependent DNA helicase PcrA
MTPDEKQLQIIITGGHLLVTGGPGSGKTTVSILKGADVANRKLRAGQRILFLSFARATVSRVIEAIEHEHKLPRKLKNRIDVETYHSCFWRLLKTHGYLLGLPRRLSILTPPSEAVALSLIRGGYAAESRLSKLEKAEKCAKEDTERLRLATIEGRVCFDLFAKYVGDILHGSGRIRKLIATMYPVIILDEFQDTNRDQWRVVQALGEHSTLVALADPEQRIYDWIGADPERLNHLKTTFTVTEFNLSTANYRSPETDIVAFGNDILVGKLRPEPYLGVQILRYPSNEAQAYTALVTTIYRARKRLVESGQRSWSLAILVPTKKMTRLVADAFRSPPAGMPAIPHSAAIEMEAAILGAEIVAFLMQPDIDGDHFHEFIDLLRAYFHGKGGDTPTRGDLTEAEDIRKAYDEYIARKRAGRELRNSSILVNVMAVYANTRTLEMTGNPDQDWRSVRRVLEEGRCPRLNGIAEEVRNIRLLERGTRLQQELSQDWLENGAYANARWITQQAFIREHFSTSAKPEVGVVVMNMHKAKGKQFDEVIIFEGWPRINKGQIVANPDRIVLSNARAKINEQARQNLRVSVTRGRKQATILTPLIDPCVLLYN